MSKPNESLMKCSKCDVALHYECLPAGIVVKREDGYHAECPKCKAHFVFPIHPKANRP